MVFALLASGCATVELPSPLAGDVPAEFSRSGAEPLPDRWWHGLDDAQLDSLIREALAENPSLKATWDRLAQANAIARRERATLWPTLDADARASRTINFEGPDSERYELGIAAAYEVDLWGRLRSSAAAARIDAEASREEVLAAAISLTAEIARTWYELIEQRGQLALLQQQIKTNEQILELVDLRFRQGQTVAADVLRQRQLVEQRRGEIHDVRSRIAVLEHQLAILLGRAPKSLQVADRQTMGNLPPLPATGLPADLIRRRPDVRRAFHDIHAASARVAAAIADRYPRIDLAASLTSAATSPGDIFSNWLATLMAQLMARIIDGGARRAEVERTEAVLAERVHLYEETVLAALKEVEDALERERRQHEKVASLRRQLEIADEVVERLRARYTQGAANYLDVLEALTTQQNLQSNLLTARRDLYFFRIDLARALAGGWTMNQPEPLLLVRT